eukprot:TRINITY_DN5376_c0_g1_i1.p1 TRINITY_DN5376_c0_g1~~TRINITY_DN5376_c0_g1_i1.p1  ORF type:complete len:104 (+),score=26.24 TRINITY_DN5376_c0_g1_i1:118-429(+)
MASSSPLCVYLVTSDQRWERCYDAINRLFTTEEMAQIFLRGVEEKYLDHLEGLYERKFTRADLRNCDIPEDSGYHLEMLVYEAHIYLCEVDTSKMVEIRIKHD